MAEGMVGRRWGDAGELRGDGALTVLGADGFVGERGQGEQTAHQQGVLLIVPHAAGIKGPSGLTCE